jgi:GIY-YIG catalytic domain-containing protein
MRMYIYGLYDRRGRLRYIGKTGNPAKRLKNHWYNRHRLPNMRRDRGDCERKQLWIRTLNAPPELRVLVIVESEVVHGDGDFCREAAFMETLIKEAAIYEFGRKQILNAKHWRQVK